MFTQFTLAQKFIVFSAHFNMATVFMESQEFQLSFQIALCQYHIT